MTLSSSPRLVESVEIQFSEAFERDVLKESFRRHLPEKTIQALLSSPTKLTLLAKELGQTQATPEAVTRLVEHCFTRYFTKSREVAIVRSSGEMKRYESELESFMRSQESQELMLLLGVAGTLTPILDGDWSINRLEEAHQALSVRNLGEFKQALAIEIAAHNDDRTLDDNSFRAVDKGTGTGIVPHTQRQNRDIADIYREQSIGIALHHDPAELVLKNFVKPKRLKDGRSKHFLEKIFGPRLKKKLQTIWERKEGSLIGQRKRLTDYHDCNIIYELLLQADEWLGISKVSYHESAEFAEENRAFADPDVYRGLIEIINPEADTRAIDLAVLEFRMRRKDAQIGVLKAHMKAQRREAEQLRAELKKLRKKPQYDEGDNEEERNKEEEYRRARIEAFTDRVTNLESAVSDGQKTITSYRDERKTLGTKAKNLQADLAKQSIQAAETEVNDNFYRHFFTDEFVEALNARKKGGKPELNLNRFTVCYPHNFVPGYFTDINELFDIPDLTVEKVDGAEILTDTGYHPNRLDFSHSLRADSHEPNDVYVQDLIGNMNAMNPGAIELSEGIYHSYSRMSRLADFWKAFKAQPQAWQDEFCVRVTTQPQTSKVKTVTGEKDLTRETPQTLVINRRSKDGCFSIKDEDGHDGMVPYFHQDATLCDFEEVMGRSDLKILDKVRRFLIGLTLSGDDVDIFKSGVHQRIMAIVDEEITRYAQKHIAAFGMWEGEDTPRPSSLSRDTRTFLASFSEENGHYRVLDEKAIDTIMKVIEGRVNEIIGPTKQALLPYVMGREGAEAFTPDRVHTFPNSHLPYSREYNRHASVPPQRLAKNQALNTPDAQRRFDQKKEEVARLLGVLTEHLEGGKPIAVIQFTDCVTNDILIKKLHELGFGRFIQVIRIDLRQDNYEGAVNQLQAFLKQGGILIGGGSWHDVYKEEGLRLKESIGEMLMETFTDPNSKLVGLGICFFYQLMVDLVGEKITADGFSTSVQVKPGMLEFGPSNVKATPQGRDHYLFIDCPKKVSLAMTHSGHWVDTRTKIDYDKTQHLIRPIASSEMTGRHVACEMFEGKLLGVQPHLEFDIVTPKDIQPTIEQLSPARSILEDTYGVPFDTFGQNFRLGTGSNPDIFPGIQTNAGDHMLVNGLLGLGKKLESQLQ